jgi:DNA-binding XRE family transcriptional regulator
MSNNRLREVRFLKRMSQWNLAILLGVHQSRISLLENGYVEPREDERKKIAKALGVRMEEIWRGNDTGPVQECESHAGGIDG